MGGIVGMLYVKKDGKDDFKSMSQSWYRFPGTLRYFNIRRTAFRSENLKAMRVSKTLKNLPKPTALRVVQ